MQKNLRSVLSLCTLALGATLISCTKNGEPELHQKAPTAAVKGRDPDLGEAAKTVSSILGELYKDPRLLASVNESIAAGYYADDRMPLKDLLYPEQSPAFQKLAPDGRARIAASSFREQFNRLLTQKKAAAGREARVKEFDETYFLQNGFAVYFPYARWFKGKSVQTITLVAAPEIDANTAPGTEYTACGQQICSKEIVADESYVQTHPTHVVQAGGVSVARLMPVASPLGKGARTTSDNLKVWIGGVRCIKQYDTLFSLTGNGGGSEIKISRTSAYLRQDSDGQVTSPENVVSVDVPRDCIASGLPVEIVAEWDQNWEQGDKEQFFAIYEEDTKGTSEYGGSIKTTLKSTGGGTVEGGVNVSIKVQTQDEIIVQHGWERTAFLAGNALNQGWGVLTPGSSHIFYPGPWAVYDGPLIGMGGANISFITPHKFY